MTTRRFLQLDVFSARPGSGNPLAVVLDAEGLDDAAMQAIARWTKLPETTFVFPAPDAARSYRLRMFSPQKEVPFAGHPSVGTAHAVLDAGLATPRDGVLVQDGIAGQLPLRVEQIAGHRSIAIRTPRARVTEQLQSDDPRLSDSLRGWPLGALPPALMDGGRTWWVVELASEAALRSLDPDWNAIAALAESTGSMGVFAYARAAATGAYDLAVRAFVGNGRRFEDAASGAANAVLAAWLDSKDALPGTDGRYVVSQGREIGFDALLELRIDANGEVWSGGQVQTVIRGTLDWE
ncbi:PhzF family phenazine biosynthesis protein [Xanthomonas campestris pv. campestris]|uniref:PhzF family phenazine biosynthesis protein n=1 Tax=Xanthomonas campestris TaxID=339 RepID=UPI001A12AEE2|nr:PhzF family phenazine biosynthesis protein [Xanthomonas campestris]MBF9174036.1 PhzF family phenazine biosynthesis protein [Xanthomonas campestris pv. campestris]MDO0844621.1 PhzF family phenazine biosynthesis protein [Xanthomonas campestris pv. campestris]MEB1412283.1 PhzF family phenazine biosynthesis protein [Xanthomonas campestris pv. campestris]MEB1458734.1 PhzF family phenazine biosynthesis protein [Xanthomonas campestris pv. campestris]MEB1499734.1 PhzF family phenazine biosynthesis 